MTPNQTKPPGLPSTTRTARTFQHSQDLPAPQRNETKRNETKRLCHWALAHPKTCISVISLIGISACAATFHFPEACLPLEKKCHRGTLYAQIFAFQLHLVLLIHMRVLYIRSVYAQHVCVLYNTQRACVLCICNTASPKSLGDARQRRHCLTYLKHRLVQP